MWDDLPIEICTNILHRLPVKTLIKCTILSKSILSLITSQPFISNHITQHADSHLFLRYFTHNKQEMYHFEPDDHNFTGFQTDGLLVPFYNHKKNCFTVAGCVNGVLCLVNDFSSESSLIILWNPSIRKFVHLPRPIIVCQTKYHSVCGFGFDPISDDYKVVQLVELDTGFEVSSETLVEVYSLKSGCWRDIGVGPCYSIKQYYDGYTPRFFNGSVYWVGTSYGPNCEYLVLRFDMSTEIFETIQLPEVLKLCESGYTRDLFLQTSERMLLTLIRSNYNDESSTCNTCSAWILKEDGVGKSWTKFFDLDIAKLRPHGMPMAFTFRKNGEVIMVKKDCEIYCGEENVVVSIDPVTQSGATLREVNAKDRSFYLSTYVESMVLFKEGKGIDEQNTPLNFFPTKR